MDYTDSCRQRVRDTLATMTDELAGTPLPAAHRYRGEAYAFVITGLIGHTTEHASQIRQFISPRSSLLVALRPLPRVIRDDHIGARTANGFPRGIAQVVENHRRKTLFAQCNAGMGTDVAGAAGDKHSHLRLPHSE